MRGFETVDEAGLSRRNLITGAGVVAGLAATKRARSMIAPTDPFLGRALMANVVRYDGFGIHRTGTSGDLASAAWIAMELRRSGFSVERHPFDVPIFMPSRCSIGLPGREIEAWPAWPVRPTASDGVTGALREEGYAGHGGIALVQLAYGPGGSWAARGVGERVLDAFRRGASAVIAVTDGPTGSVIELNAMTEPFQWPGPVVLAAGRYASALADQAAKGSNVTVSCVGNQRPGEAFNIIGRRPGRGKAIAVSTPLSGWFQCAGERGSGIAAFLALARWIDSATDRPLFFTANSGHELSNLGARAMLKSAAPAPADTGLWVHIGANVAVNRIAIADGVASAEHKPAASRTVQVTESVMADARQAFAGVSGYDTPVPLSRRAGLGETKEYLEAGYGNVLGMVGENPLFHTPLDRANVATSPEVLEPVARALRRFMERQIA